jgi:hypothetical protein
MYEEFDLTDGLEALMDYERMLRRRMDLYSDSEPHSDRSDNYDSDDPMPPQLRPSYLESIRFLRREALGPCDADGIHCWRQEVLGSDDDVPVIPQRRAFVQPDDDEDFRGLRMGWFHGEAEGEARAGPPEEEVEVERGATEDDFQRILEESKREEEERKEIRIFMSDPRRVRSVLRAMEGVDAKDPCFKEFGV